MELNCRSYLSWNSQTGSQTKELPLGSHSLRVQHHNFLSREITKNLNTVKTSEHISMPGRGRGQKRKRREEKEVQEQSEPERIHILNSNQHEAASGPEQGRSTFVADFDQIFQNAVSAPAFEQPPLLRCGGDSLGAHVPEQIKTKIKQNEYVNLSILLKGSVELNDMYSATVLGVDEEGRVVTKPKLANTEKISTIEKWTDAFLIFSSIYLSAHPEMVQDLMQYMYVIREAAAKYSGTMWRTYDEQFRLRQAINFSKWSEINADLWLRSFSAPLVPHQQQLLGPQQRAQAPPCIDFNKGFCKFVDCRYPHVCARCYSAQHGKWACYTQSTRGDSFRPNRPYFRGSGRGFGRSKSAYQYARGQNNANKRGYRY